jgi:hypothetical protein
VTAVLKTAVKINGDRWAVNMVALKEPRTAKLRMTCNRKNDPGLIVRWLREEDKNRSAATFRKSDNSFPR